MAQTVFNGIDGQGQANYDVNKRDTTDGTVQRVQLDIGTTTAESPVTAANPLPTNLAQVAGTTTAVNAGNASAGTQRTVLATDQAFTFSQVVGGGAVPANAVSLGYDNIGAGTWSRIGGTGGALYITPGGSAVFPVTGAGSSATISVSGVAASSSLSIYNTGSAIAYSFVEVAISSTSAHAGVSFDFQVQPYSGAAWITTSLMNQSTGVTETGVTTQTNMNNVWKGHVRGLNFRLNITAISSGTLLGVMYSREIGGVPNPTIANGSGSGAVNIQDGGNSVTIDAVSLPLPTGAATASLQTQPGVDIGDVTINNAAGASAVNIQDGGNSITVDGTVSAVCAGDIAHDAADSGNPVKIGGKALTADPTAVATGDRVNALFDKLGKQVFLQNALLEKHGKATSASSITTTTSTSLVAATASVIRVITAITVSNMHASVATIVNILDGTTVVWHGPAGAGGGGYSISGLKLVGTVNTAINVQCVTTGASVRASVNYFEIAG